MKEKSDYLTTIERDILKESINIQLNDLNEILSDSGNKKKKNNKISIVTEVLEDGNEQS